MQYRRGGAARGVRGVGGLTCHCPRARREKQFLMSSSKPLLSSACKHSHTARSGAIMPQSDVLRLLHIKLRLARRFEDGRRSRQLDSMRSLRQRGRELPC